jgi:hypothetical protein
MVWLAVRSKWASLVLASLVTVALAFVAPADQPPAPRPRILFASDVPTDLEALARSTWLQFTDGFPAWWRCLPDVRVSGAWELPVRADYQLRGRLVTIRIPGTAPNLRATLVHEFAHHLEFTCPQQRLLRSRFLAAQGLPPKTPWFRGPTWDRIPSEQFAEGTVWVVLGRSASSRVRLTPRAITIIRGWGRGR